MTLSEAMVAYVIDAYMHIPALVQLMGWCWPGDKPLSEPMMVNFLTHELNNKEKDTMNIE